MSRDTVGPSFNGLSPNTRDSPPIVFRSVLSTSPRSYESSLLHIDLKLQMRLLSLERELSRSSNPDESTIEMEFVFPVPAQEMLLADETRAGIPALKWCASCSRETTTRVLYKSTARTFLASVAFLLSGGLLGCCVLPYLADSCKQSSLQCGHCSHTVK